MDLHEYNIKFNDIEITKSEIGAHIGYSKEDIPNYFLDNIKDILLKFEENTQLLGGFRIFENININKKDISINEKNFVTSKIITKALQNSELIAIFACTAGHYADHLIKSYKNANTMLNSYLADLIASLIVEKCSDYICNKIQKLFFNKSMKITNRFSPGYCNWNVSDQKRIFSLLPDNFCGINLNDFSLMIPLKSVSGIIGIGKNVNKENYNCSSCTKADCLIFK